MQCNKDIMQRLFNFMASGGVPGNEIRSLLKLLALLTLAAAPFRPVHAQTFLTASSFSSGGIESSNTEYRITSTLGEAAVGTSNNTLLLHGAGFWFAATNAMLSVNTEGDGPGAEIPDAYQLDANYPNPFNPTTQIRYGLPEASAVRLVIFNLLGQVVQVLVNDQEEAGYHTVMWDGFMANGQAAPSGLYLYRIDAGDFSETRKMMLVK